MDPVHQHAVVPWPRIEDVDVALGRGETAGQAVGEVVAAHDREGLALPAQSRHAQRAQGQVAIDVAEHAQGLALEVDVLGRLDLGLGEGLRESGLELVDVVEHERMLLDVLDEGQLGHRGREPRMFEG